VAGAAFGQVARRGKAVLPVPKCSNELTRESLAFIYDPANRYLDRLLGEVYPQATPVERTLSPDVIKEIRSCKRNNRDLLGLVDLLMDERLVPRFPLEDRAVGMLKELHRATPLNYKEWGPKSVQQIVDQFAEMDVEEIIARCEQPASTSRQYGGQFQQYTERLGYEVLGIDKALESTADVVVVRGSDKTLLDLAKSELGFQRRGDNRRGKGLDLVMRVGSVWVVGEAKLLSRAVGGNQRNQLDDALRTLRAKVNDNVQRVAVLDGAIYPLRDIKRGFGRAVVRSPDPIISALLLDRLVEHLRRAQGM